MKEQGYTLSRFLTEKQEDEGVSPIELVSEWDEKNMQQITSNFKKAWRKGNFSKLEIRLPPKPEKPNQPLSNQSRGIQLWNKFRTMLQKDLTNYTFKKCKESGYPDQQLVSDSGTSFAFEEKAHSNWDENDGNRIVIASSTKRLRATFTPPINHIWATLYNSYRLEGNTTVCTLHRLDLHFAEPGTLVNRRLEGSTSNKTLRESVEKGIHKKETFGTLPK